MAASCVLATLVLAGCGDDDKGDPPPPPPAPSMPSLKPLVPSSLPIPSFSAPGISLPSLSKMPTGGSGR